MASYEVDGPTGLRTQPIDCLTGSSATDCPSAGGGAGAGGYTYGDFAKIRGGAEPHDDGEIWGQALWQLRESLIAVHGPSDGITRRRAARDERAAARATQPVLPRHAQRDPAGRLLANGGDRGLIWSVFANRGMGYAASTVDTDDVHPLQDFTTRPGGVDPRGQPGRRGARPGHGRAARGSARGILGPRQRAGRGSRYAHGANGSYRIDGVPARTWSHVTIAPAAGYDRAVAKASRSWPAPPRRATSR